MKDNMINNLVKRMVETHKGGEVFFDNLDDAIRNDINLLSSFMSIAYDYIENSEDPINYIVLSGNFGRAVSSFGITIDIWNHYKIKTILVSGGLRVGNKIEDFEEFLDENSSKNFLFLDDSFYSGTTRNVIRDKIQEYGGKLLKTIVLYDGSLEKDDTVSSMYRYYDNHEEGK